MVVLAFVLGSLAGPALAATYQVDILESGNPGGWTGSLKTFDTTYQNTVPQTLEIDIWMTDTPGGATAGGAFLDFRGSTDKITYVSVLRYNNEAGQLPGPWQMGAGVVVEAEPGLLVVVVGNLGTAQPDGDGDMIIAKLTVDYLATGTGEIAVSTIEGVATWGPSPPWDDASIPVTTLTLNVCTGNQDCDDGLFCNGTETCVDGSCVAGIDPCPDDGLWCNGDAGCDEVSDLCIPGEPRCQDDGLFCNGDESCDENNDQCLQSNLPCPDDGDPCTDDCNEPTDTCYVCNATGTDDTCCLDSPVCETAEVCLVEFNDFYVDGTNGDNLNDGLSPGTAWKTITHGLSQVPLLVALDGNNRANIHVAASTYDTVMVEGDAETFPLVMIEYVSLLGAGYTTTIIDAEQTESVILFEKEADIHNVTVDGFTITGGFNFRGGGFTVLWADPTISNCSIKDNTSYAINGGGIYLQRSNATIFNCIIKNNTALQQKGGGISCGNISSPDIINCTIVYNAAGCDADEGGGGISVGADSAPNVKNTILWGNYRNCAPDPELDQILEADGSFLTITHSCIQGGHSGDGNTDQDPLFRGADDYNLMYGSSCIESADSEGAPENDIDGNARFDACFIPDTGIGPFTYYDRGAIEYQGDSDGDGILDDADGSCTVGDSPCSGGVTETCDDNCIFTPNVDQDDAGDSDGIGTVCDNCPDHPNGTLLGTCAKDINPHLFFILGTPCADMNGCGENEFCLMNQEDSNGNGIGDVCECESDFNCDQNVDADDVVVFLDDFGRNQFNNPCVAEDPCLGDLDCDRDVDADDVTKFLEDFGRSLFNNPCPVCSSQSACAYE